MDNFIKSSKALAYYLRHSNLPDNEGWVSVELLVGGFGFTLELLEDLVAEDGKNRYELSEDHLFVRARQGHSIKVDPGLVKDVPPHELFHGTSMDKLSRILMEGLKPMSREYVHLSLTVDAAIEVGRRHGEPLVLKVDAGKMVADGVEFLVSSNGIWMAGHIAPRYISIVSHLG